jgi:hypothetical protein
MHAHTNLGTLSELNCCSDLALQLAFLFWSLFLHALFIVRVGHISLGLLGCFLEELRMAQIPRRSVHACIHNYPPVGVHYFSHFYPCRRAHWLSRLGLGFD